MSRSEMPKPSQGTRNQQHQLSPGAGSRQSRERVVHTTLQLRRWLRQVFFRLQRLDGKRATAALILAILLTSGTIVLVAYTARWIDTSGQPAVMQSAGQGPAPTRLKEYIYGGGRLLTTEEKSCVPTISPGSQNIAETGGGGTISVTISQGCSWTAVSNVSWIRVTPEADRVSYVVEANGGAQRTGTVSINGQVFTVNQNPNPLSCSYSMNITSQGFSEFAAGGAFNVITQPGCGWNASSDVSWVTVTAGADGVGSGTVSFSVAANGGGAERIGHVLMGGQAFTVTQAPNQGSCGFSASPGGQGFGTGGGGGSFSVGTGKGCNWDAAVDGAGAGWITITGGAVGTSSGTVSFSVGVNNGPARSGTIFIKGQPKFTITQELNQGSCGFSASPGSQSFGPEGAVGGGAFNVQAAFGCIWNATADVGWVTITGATGINNGTVNFSVGANNGPERRGTIFVKGQPVFTVNQTSGCTYTVLPRDITISENGGAGTINVTTLSNCPWTITGPIEVGGSGTSWISNPGVGGLRFGSGSLRFEIPFNNTGKFARVVDFIVAGQMVRIHQPNLIPRGGGLQPLRQPAP